MDVGCKCFRVNICICILHALCPLIDLCALFDLK